MTMDQRLAMIRQAPLTWDAITGGKRTWPCFDDHVVADLGPDPDGVRFEAIAKQMLEGHYYPPDVITFSGDFRSEGRQLQKGDRVLQFLSLWPGSKNLGLWGSVEMSTVEHSADFCKIGYVTTELHHGKGSWSASLRRVDGNLEQEVEGSVMPHSWLFWVGMPIARYYQKRAWRRAIAMHRGTGC